MVGYFEMCDWLLLHCKEAQSRSMHFLSLDAFGELWALTQAVPLRAPQPRHTGSLHSSE